MIRYIINRILLMFLVLLGVMIFIFALGRAPGTGDPVIGILGEHYTQEAYDELHAKLGLDKPIVTQFFDYLWGVVTRLDLGTSYYSKRAVSSEVFARFPVSLRVAMNAVMISVPVGIILGMIAAYYQYSALDYSITVTSMLGQAMPNFWLGIMLILIFSLSFKWFPATGLSTWRGYVLPALTMASTPISTITRMTRATMLDVIRQDYIRTARSKGLSERRVIFGHALQNASIPIVTLVGNQIALTVGGAAVVENIFLIPGLGSFLIFSINANDHPSVQGTVLMFSMFVTLINILVDILYGFIDPRIKAKYTSASRMAKKLNKSVLKATAKEVA